MEEISEKLELLSAAELGREVRGRRVSPTEVIRYFRERIEKRSPSLGAFVYTRFGYAEQEAEKLEKRMAEGKIPARSRASPSR